MSFTGKMLPVVFAAAALAAGCSESSAPTQALSRPASSLASKGGSGGGGGGGGGGTVTQLVVTTPPTVSAAGTWVGTTDGPDVTHTYTYKLNQTGAGIVSGSGTIVTPFTTVSELVAGTVNGDTLTLYVGVQCGTCTLAPSYRGIISASGSQVNGSFLSGGVSPLTLFKQ